MNLERLTKAIRLGYRVPASEISEVGLGIPSEAANKPLCNNEAAFLLSGVPLNGGPDGAAAMRAGASPEFQLRSVCHPAWNRDGGIKTATEATIMTNTHPLVFQNTCFDIVDHNGDSWLKAAQISNALGYADEKAIHRIFARHADEFTSEMTAVVKLTTPFGEQETRIFSPRGCYALAMFARTSNAKIFRVWVMDVLESIRKTGRYESAPYSANPTDKLTIEQADTLRKLLTEAVRKLPRERQASAMIKGWSKLKAHFKVGYRDIPQSEFTEAVSIIARHVIEGEFLPARKEEAVEAAALAELTRPGRKFLTVFWKDKETGEINPVITSLPEDGVYLELKEFASYIGDAGGRVSRQMLPAIINAAATRLAA